jgi:flagellum-specific ATP synthase
MFAADALQKLRAGHASMPQEPRFEKLGKVSDIVGTLIEAHLKEVPLGALVRIFDENNTYNIQGEVVGFRKDKALIVPFGDPAGVCANGLVQCVEREPRIRVGHHLVGRIIDGYCNPIIGPKFQPTDGVPWAIAREPINPLTRRRISRPLDLGVRSLNSLLTCGEGQRMGIFAGSGVGKSVLMGMVGRYTQADINVIALIGERGREVKEFIDDCLGEEGLKRSVVVVSTGDQSPLIRVRAAHVATAISEYFRECGYSVLLMMDSLTRVAMAQREIGLAVGEPPTTKGYTPSVFSLLPRLLERAGNSASKGSLTGIYTVLVDGDDFNEPVCDAARSILDGHVVLSRDLAAKNHYPAVDILRSASRVMVDVASKEQLSLASDIRNLLATYKHNEDLISIGAYNRGSNPLIDRAIDMQPVIEQFLKQDRHDNASFEASLAALSQLLRPAEAGTVG